jgi:hypothetical protein
VSLSGVAVEKVHFFKTARKFGNRKCLSNWRKSSIGRPDGILFLRISREEFFNSHRREHGKRTVQRFLDQFRLARGNPAIGSIFATMKGTPLSLNNVLNRQILPAFNVCEERGKCADEHGKETPECKRDSRRREWRGCIYGTKRSM